MLHTFPFLNDEEPSQESFDFFMNSAHGIRFFLNSPITEELPKDFMSKKDMIRFNGNRIGHALHAFNPIFKDFTFSQPMKDVIKSIKFKKPIVCQSMYLLKQNFKGSSECGHQAATYIHVEPPSKLVSLWMAIDDNSEKNGCLQFIPGSHKESLQTKFIRNPCMEEFNQGKRLIYTNDSVKFDQNKYVSVPLKSGDAILIHSLVVHKCLNCDKPNPRDIFAFHVYDSDNSTFSKDNWMEYNEETFLPLF